jgi:hypothetical protein
MRSNSPPEADAPVPSRSIATTANRNDGSRLTGSTQYTAAIPASSHTGLIRRA